MDHDALFAPLTLPNGVEIPNRLCKAAMEENLADAGQLPGEDLVRLYRRWAEGGAGLLLTGNVMIAPDALTGPGGVVLQEGTDLSPFRRWAEAGRSEGAQFWMQISHPGRQLFADMGEIPLAPSAVPVDVGKHSHLLAQPREMTLADIEDIIERFVTTAALAEQAGFTGVEIHAAHGYLISQFLSPLVNRREDEWGGSLANRARLLFGVVEGVRARVAPGFCVAVKLNSADFQQGGFDLSHAMWVVEQLNEMRVDLVELSGGSYESPAMQGRASDSSTHRREAYFIDFARKIARVATMPLMVTGGIKRRDVATLALAQDAAGFRVDMLGMARALAFAPDAPNRWRVGKQLDVVVPEVGWRNQVLASLATQALAKAQIVRMARGKPVKPGMSALRALIADRLRTRRLTKRYRAWRAGA